LDQPDVVVSLGGRSSPNGAAPVFLPLVVELYVDNRRSRTGASLLSANDRRQHDDLLIASSRLAKYDTLDLVAYQPVRDAVLGAAQSSNRYAPRQGRLRSLELESVLSNIAADISEQWHSADWK
jgi:hypothetical protein